ncbi:HGGxSTG domain-containing protein [Muricoccus aerilatus]|uniref:HGGxSTG domain-containing protein n=1 Tax=Muricoccus aerilatus TaxID=452982 RepID=UPI000A0146CD|nr:HGGxSTG domain-containing protein [Roseomonas aerilata]
MNPTRPARTCTTRLDAAPRCGARARSGDPCCAPAMRNGRCRFHGGKSTGPLTTEGIERILIARMKHGRHSGEAVAFRRRIAELNREARAVMAFLRGEGV